MLLFTSMFGELLCELGYTCTCIYTMYIHCFNVHVIGVNVNDTAGEWR